jgi:VWFA-related protein
MLAAFGNAQTTKSTPVSATPPAQAPAAAQPQSTPPSAQPPVSLQVQANLVLVDVVVTNNGAAVSGLPKEKFHLLENGKPQAITVFEEHRPEDALAIANVPPPEPNVYNNFPDFTISSAANVLLLDALNTPLSDQMRVRQQMIQYLKNIPPGTRIAVFTLASRLRIVEGFTTDSSVITKALSGKGGPQQSVVLDTDADQESADMINDMTSAGASGQAIASLQQFQADLASFQTDLRVRMTLDAMKDLARYLNPIPGRKNLIWFSGSFPLAIDPDATLQSPFQAMRNYADDVRQADDMLSAARVAVYPVDARGLMSLPSTNAANRYSSAPGMPGGFGGRGGRRGATPGGGMPGPPSGGTTMSPAAAADQKFLQQTTVEHATMKEIAADTGGEAFVDTNGLKEAVTQAIANGSRYYTVGYVPQISKYDGSFHRLKVAVDGGYATAYRRGYYADDPAKAEINPQVATNIMVAAVQRGAPPLSQILFKVRVLPSDDPAVKAVRVSPDPAGVMAASLKKPARRYFIDYAVDPRAFAFTTSPDGVHHANLDFAVIAYDTDGKRLNYVDRGAGLNLSDESYKKVMRSGMPMHQEIDLPEGRVYLRVVVQDLNNGRIGSIEVPVTVPKQ